MPSVLPLQNVQRMKIAALIAGIGAIVAYGVTLSDHHVARMVPQSGFHLAALVGAGVAGFFFAGTFGRPGILGAFIALLGAIGVTVSGAILGSMLIAPTPFHFEAAGLAMYFLVMGVLENALVLKLWLATMAILHVIIHARRISLMPR